MVGIIRKLIGKLQKVTVHEGSARQEGRCAGTEIDRDSSKAALDAPGKTRRRRGHARVVREGPRRFQALCLKD